MIDGTWWDELINDSLKTLRFFALLFCLSSSFSGSSLGAEILLSEQQHITLLPHIRWYYDAAASATVQQLSARPTLFQNSLKNASLARAKGAYWLRFSLRATAAAAANRWLLELPYTQLDAIDLYSRTGSSSAWQRQQMGDLRPVSEQESGYPQPVFHLPLNKDEVTEVFLRVQSSTSISVPLVLWQQRPFDVRQQQNTLINGIVYGVLIGLLFYNLFLYPTVKDNAYLWFSAYLTTFLFFQFTMAGLTRLYLFPDWPAAVDRSASLALWLCMASSLRFTQYISLSQQFSPRLDRVFSAIVSIALLMFALVAVLGPGPLFIALPIFGVAVALLIPLPLFTAWQAKYPPAKFTLLAFFPIFPGVALLVARTYGVIDASFWTEHLLPLGTAMGAVLLSFALADRISFLRNEKIAAQTKLIETIQAADAAKKQFSAQLINAQDSERKRLAEELHDGVGQNLSFLASSINRLAKKYKGSELQHAKQVSRDSVNEVRAISHKLHPHILDQLGLVTAIESIAEHVNNQYAIKCSIAISPELGKLDTDTELHLYRIVQESVNNAIKHSQASTLHIALQRTAEALILTITDNGSGLNPAMVTTNSGLGLNSMKRRAALLGGTFERHTMELQGMRVVVTLPVKETP